MNFLDVLFLVILGIFALRGLLRGFLKEVLSLAGMVVGFWLASKYNVLLAPHLAAYIKGDGQALAVAWLVIFIAATVLVWILIRVASSFLKVSMLGWLDAVSGGVFGFVEGLLLVLVVVVLLLNFMPTANFVSNSSLMPRLERTASVVLEHLPEGVGKTLEHNGLRLPKVSSGLFSTDKF
ncbi:MAG: rane protein required for colicin production [Desulfovibrionales bacterium]|nr:rane protein required for colicin production [Desulfovibrionales bacterium]